MRIEGRSSKMETRNSVSSQRTSRRKPKHFGWREVPPGVFSEVFILKGFKRSVLEVRILKGLERYFS